MQCREKYHEIYEFRVKMSRNVLKMSDLQLFFL